MAMAMMQRIVSRSAGRRMQQHVARKQTEACRSLSSCTTAISPNTDTTRTTTTTTTTTSNRSYSSNSNDDDTRLSSQTQGSSEFRRAYVHPLSQVVLEYLQEHHHSWIVYKGLDRSLRLHRDGSFEAKYVPLSSSSSYAAAVSASTYSPLPSIHDSNKKSGGAEPVISESMSATATMKMNRNINTNRNRNRNAPTASGNDNESATSKTASSSKGPFQELAATPATTTHTDNDKIRIWTSFDEQEKKHWLTVRKGLFRQRFLLQDNLVTAWQGNRGTSLPERIHVAVDEMIRAVDRLDNGNDQQQQKQSSPHTMMGHYQQWQQKDQMQFPKR